MRTRKLRKNKTRKKIRKHVKSGGNTSTKRKSTQGPASKQGSARNPKRNKKQGSLSNEDLIQKIIFDPVSETHFKEISIISMVLIRALSLEMQTRTRNKKGITSCRQLVVLIILFPYSEELFSFNFPEIINKQDINTIGIRRKLLSKIWRYTLQEKVDTHPALKDFFADNKIKMVDRVILDKIDLQDKLQGQFFNSVTPANNIGSPVLYDLIDGIYPMALTNCEGEYISHYFIVEVSKGRKYIYTAYGSDYLKAHPEKIELNLEDFNSFIREGNKLCNKKNAENSDKEGEIIRKFFIEYFTQNADNFLQYFDEGVSKTKIISKKKGIEEELKLYTDGFRVMYFPTVKDDLLAASRDDIGELGIEALKSRVL